MADEHPTPMVRLDPGPDGPPALSYNVPDPTSYSGRNFIALDLGPLDPFSPQITVAENGDAVLRIDHVNAAGTDELGEVHVGALRLGSPLRLSGASGPLVRSLLNSGVIGFTRGDPS